MGGHATDSTTHRQHYRPADRPIDRSTDRPAGRPADRTTDLTWKDYLRTRCFYSTLATWKDVLRTRRSVVAVGSPHPQWNVDVKLADAPRTPLSIAIYILFPIYIQTICTHIHHHLRMTSPPSHHPISNNVEGKLHTHLKQPEKNDVLMKSI